MRARIAGLLGVTLFALGLATLSAASASAGIKPKSGTYAGNMPGAEGENRVEIEIVKRNRVFQVKLLDAKDDCSAHLLLPTSLGHLRKGRFHLERDAVVSNTDVTITINGRITSRTRVTVTLRSTRTGRPPDPVLAGPGCPDATTFTLKFLPDGL